MSNYCFNSIITVFLAQIILCIAQQTSTISEKRATDLGISEIKANELAQELVTNIYQSIQPAQQSPAKSVISAQPIVCYECNSHRDPDCITSPEKFVKNCTNLNKGSNYIGCWKIEQWVDYDSADLKAHHRIVRQCASNGDISKPCYYRAGFGGKMNACFCDKDLCNSSHTIKFNNFSLVVISLITIIYVSLQ